jgi:hypothetical protein
MRKLLYIQGFLSHRGIKNKDISSADLTSPPVAKLNTFPHDDRYSFDKERRKPRLLLCPLCGHQEYDGS